MQSDIVVNVKEPDVNDDVVVPTGIGTNTPNTGYLGVEGSSSANGIDANIVALSLIGAIILAITIVFILVKEHHSSLKRIFKHRKYAIYSLVALAMLVSMVSCFGLKDLNGTDTSNIANAASNNENTLAITVDSTSKIDVTLEDNPAYAYMKNTVTVTSSTEAGYTLTANIIGNDKDLINITNPEASNSTISGLEASSDASDTKTLNDNTWGISLTEPTSQDSNVFLGLPTEGTDPLTLVNKDSATPANDTTDVYLGTYVTPDLPYGTYSGVAVTYTAVANEPPILTMQDFDYEACSNLTTNKTITLTDIRDNKEYTVAKLQDGNCWMTQNLALGSDEEMELTQADSSVGPSGFTLPASVAEGDWAGSYGDPEFFDYAGNYDDSSTKYGSYYNWAAATAGSGTSTTTSGDAAYSICPKNWRLPSAGSSYATSEQYNMIKHYINSGTWNSNPYYYWSGTTITDFTTPPASLVFSGFYYSGIDEQENYSYWWSSTTKNSYATYLLYIDSNGRVFPRDDYDKDTGYSVRCLVKEPTIENGMYMQDVTQEQISNTPTDVVYTLKDRRDETEYTVAKLKDGNLWMTQNLALGSSTPMSLTQADSNVGPSGFTLPASVAEGTWTDSRDDPEFFDYAGNYDDSSTKYGNYYNWVAATAGSGTSAIDQDGDEAQYSICPKNWRLPSAGSSYAASEQYNMINSYINSGTWDDSDPGWSYWYHVTTTDFINTPTSLAFSGHYYSGVSGHGDHGGWWASTTFNSNYACNLHTDNIGYVDPRYYDDKKFGYSVRCLMPRS